MTETSKPDQPFKSIIPEHWLRPSAAWALAVAMASGTFAVPIQGMLPTALDWLAEPRYICILLALMVGVFARPLGPITCRRIPEMRWIIVIWSIYAFYALARSLWVLPSALTWGNAAPIVLLPLTLAAVSVVINTRGQATHFFNALLALLGTAAAAFIIIDLQSTTDVPFRSFYSSRTFYIGAVVAIFLAAMHPARSGKFAIAVGLAILLLYAGLASAMRASLVFYASSLLFGGCLLIAARQLRALALVVLIAISGYALHWAVNAPAIQEKVSAYSPVRSTSFDKGEGDEHNYLACRQRMADVSVEPAPGTDTYSCQMHFTIYDVDSRIRLLLQTLNTNKSPLFGSGLGAFQFIEASRSESEVGIYKHPHNILAEVYHATGLVGLALIGATIVLVIALVLRFAVDATYPVAILTAIPAFTGLSGLVGGNLYDARFFWIAPLLMAAFFIPKITESDTGQL